jgi:ion channel-forming bestrophin family protein
MMGLPNGSGFWREAFALSGSATPHVFPNVLLFGVIAAAIDGSAWLLERAFGIGLGLEVAPFEIAGAALGLLLILRTNAGYDRWWEARKLWGGIVNQCRNFAISALAYGPTNPDWQEKIVRWAVAFPLAARDSLRGLKPDAAAVLGPDAAERLQAANHGPNRVALELAALLREGCDLGMDRFAFLRVDEQRAMLIDHIGACERILKTPLPTAYSIKIRRFIALFLLTLPFALLHQLEAVWQVPFVTMLVAYPLLSLDRIGVELQNPFSTANLSHLPLDDISATIERNLMALLKERQAAGVPAEKSV